MNVHVGDEDVDICGAISRVRIAFEGVKVDGRKIPVHEDCLVWAPNVRII